jgi:hypothetical protein
MPSPAASRNHLASCHDDASAARQRWAPLAPSGRLHRLLLRVARGLSADESAPVPVRVYYKFDSGCWRSRNTQQLHKVYRCR